MEILIKRRFIRYFVFEILFYRVLLFAEVDEDEKWTKVRDAAPPARPQEDEEDSKRKEEPSSRKGASASEKPKGKGKSKSDVRRLLSRYTLS